MDYKAKVIAELRGLGDGTIPPADGSAGLCYHLHTMCAPSGLPCLSYKHIRNLMEEWPQGTGNYSYPVPCVLGKPCSEIRAKNTYHERILLWGNNAYGRARKAMCLWLADQLEQDKGLVCTLKN